MSDPSIANGAGVPERPESSALSDLLETEIRAAAGVLTQISKEIGKVLVGQEYLVRRLLTGLLCNQHVLIEGVPGLAKTLSVTSLARAIGLDFNRIQFTPDLLPADVVGTLIYSPRSGEFTTKKGPVFANIVLADEINRAPAKVQSALLESMQERQVTLGEETLALPRPFMVMATQNPVDQEGTYPLPEAQVDRFMLKLRVDYPSREEEIGILRRMAATEPLEEIRPVTSAGEIISFRALLDRIYMDPAIQEYVVDLVRATRAPGEYGLEIDHLIRFGASPRATIYLTIAAKAEAFISGRGWVSPDDVGIVAPDVLRHRILPSYEAEAEGRGPEDLLDEVFRAVSMP
jgi:MoxR-like ATPase